MNEVKCVILLDEDLPIGVQANSAAILGASLGKRVPDCVGKNLPDSLGHIHIGLIKIPVPILKANNQKIKDIREKLYHSDFAGVIAVDFSNISQASRNYDEYAYSLEHAGSNDLTYLGIALYGDKKLINKLTGNLPLLK